MDISRNVDLKVLQDHVKAFPATGLLGPRQCGKTTLAKHFIERNWRRESQWFDLEDPRDLDRLENPMQALEPLKGLVVIDEVQRRPELFPVLRVLIDALPQRRFLILGSSSRDLLRQSSETLAGRISYMDLGGFRITDLASDKCQRLWIRGGFPRSLLAKEEQMSFVWRENFISTFLERDIPMLGFHTASHMLRRFWTLLAHSHGNIFNASELARGLQLSSPTAQHHLDVMTGSLVLRQLRPFHVNTRKKLVKRPKVYIRDSGLLHALLRLSDEKAVRNHPCVGASWEGFILEQSIIALNLRNEDANFFGAHEGPEMDLVYRHSGGAMRGIEVKFSENPEMTASIHQVIDLLKLEKVFVIHPGNKRLMLHDKVEALPATNISELSA